MAVMEPISPELVLVDPALAAVERPHESAMRVIARQVVPLGVPLVPRETPARRPAWMVVVIGACLLTSGLVFALLLFSGSSAAPNQSTTVVSTVVGTPPDNPIPSVGLPTPP
jgi:hypothetical protein